MMVLVDGESVALGFGSYVTPTQKQLPLLLPLQMALRDEII